MAVFFFCLITYTRGPLDFSVSTPFCDAIMASHCSRRSSTQKRVGTGTKKALPLQNLFHQRAFVFCASIQYELNVHTHARMHARDNNSARDVLTIHCHVHNTTSPGFSVMTKGCLHAPGLCLALESVSNQERAHNSNVHFHHRKCYLHILKAWMSVEDQSCHFYSQNDIFIFFFFYCDGEKRHNKPVY